MHRKTRRGILEEYEKFLPLTPNTPRLSLGEGSTPLVAAKNLPRILQFDGRIYFKLEGLNPTGSFKDRGMVVAMAKALEEGTRTIICASTGNTAASAAAYAACAGMQAIVVLPAGKVAKGKLAQALIHGACVVEVQGNFDEALRVVREIASTYKVELVNSVNAYRLEGQKTAAFEIVEALQEFPDFHFIPVGNAGNIAAYWKGYNEYAGHRFEHGGLTAINFFGPLMTRLYQNSFRNNLPRMMGYQAEGAAPIVRGHVIEHPETIASAIRIGNPARWREAIAAVEESNGMIDFVTDAEILQAYNFLARYEGIFCEPSSAVALAGFMKANRQYLIPSRALVVCTLTGNGLKDPDAAASECTPPLEAPSDSERIANFFNLEKK